MKHLYGLWHAPWNKPEKAKERRAKLPQTEAVEEWHVTIKTTPFLIAVKWQNSSEIHMVI